MLDLYFVEMLIGFNTHLHSYWMFSLYCNCTLVRSCYENCDRVIGSLDESVKKCCLDIWIPSEIKENKKQIITIDYIQIYGGIWHIFMASKFISNAEIQTLIILLLNFDSLDRHTQPLVFVAFKSILHRNVKLFLVKSIRSELLEVSMDLFR